MVGMRRDQSKLGSRPRKQREGAAERKRPRPSSRENRKDGEPSWKIVTTSHTSAPRSRPVGPQCKARSAMQRSWRTPQTRSTATALAVALRGKQNPLHRNSPLPAADTH